MPRGSVRDRVGASSSVDAGIDEITYVTTDITTTSATFATIMSIALVNTVLADLNLQLAATYQHFNSGVALFRIQVDGVTVANGTGGTSGAGQAVSLSLCTKATSVASGPRILSVDWAVASAGQDIRCSAATSPSIYTMSFRAWRLPQ